MNHKRQWHRRVIIDEKTPKGEVQRNNLVSCCRKGLFWGLTFFWLLSAACSGTESLPLDSPGFLQPSAESTPTASAATAPTPEPLSVAAMEHLAKKHYAQGHELLAQYNYLGALRQFDEAIRLAPLYGEAYLSRAGAYFEFGLESSSRESYLKAVEDVAVVIQLDPDNSAAFLLRGDARSMLGQLESAIEDYSEVIRLEPENSTPYQNRSIIHRDLCHGTEALEDAEKAVETEPALFDLIAFTEAELARTC